MDRFGNAITDLGEDRFERCRPGAEALVEVRGMRFRVERTYAAGRAGRPIAIFGSSGRPEIAIRGDSAARRLRLVCGSTVIIRLDRQ